MSETGGAGDVGKEDDVALFGEDGGVPACAPFVEVGCYGAAVYPEEEWVIFIGGEGGGFYDEGLEVVGACAVVAGDLDFADLRGVMGEMGGAVIGLTG